jgi:hypothetical protein
MDFIKNQFVGIIALVAVVLVGLGGGDSLGSNATTITNPWTFAEPTGTTTVTIQSTSVGGCLAIEQSDGSGYGYFTADSTGSLATTTASGC